MQIVKTYKNGKATENVYRANHKQAVRYINWINSQKVFTYENISKGNFHALCENVSIRYNFHNNLLTVTVVRK